MLQLQDLKDFSIHNWYERFKHISLTTVLIEIPLALLKEFRENNSDINLSEVCSDAYVNQVKNAINAFDNNVFIKNNWHAPMDAKMFSFGNQLKVTNINDLCLYLSTSNIISDDFSNEQNDFPFYLAFKPWRSIHPASEFRCIVINKILRGITPRDWPTFYEHYKHEGPLIIDTLENFYRENIADRFTRNTYTFDIIMDYPDHKPLIIDFGPLNNKTELYAFSWKEILPLLTKEIPQEVPPIFRYLDSDIGIMTKKDAISKVKEGFQQE